MYVAIIQKVETLFPIIIITWDIIKCLKLVSLFDKGKAGYRRMETREKNLTARR
jgi:hypothetical protein